MVVLSATAAAGVVSTGIGSVVMPMLWSHLTVHKEADVGVSASTVYCSAAEAPDASAAARAKHMEDIVARCPALASPRYVPPSFAKGTMSNAALSLVKRKVARLPMVHEACEADGDVSISWAADEATQALPADAPVVAFLHTINGDASQTQHLCETACARGWRSVVLVRRGHGGSLSIPRFNILGSVEDTRLQMAQVEKRFPEASFTGMVGLSAGSGLLVNYLGQEGAFCAVDAAVGACPAYDISETFRRLREESPVADRYMVRSLKRTFLEGNEELLRAHDAAAFEACERATSLCEFIGAHAPFALGVESAGENEYFEACNPMKHYTGCATPLLFVNAEDDMVCAKRHIREDLVRSTAGVALLRTKRGSHVAFNEGLLGQGSFLSRVTFDFLDAARDAGAAVPARRRAAARATAGSSAFERSPTT
jgi:predicted alpha/beta-fold hydrolase